MTGYNTILKIRELEQECNKRGMRIGASPHAWGHENSIDIVSVFPADNALPMYHRDAELFTGTLESLNVWLRGVEWMHNYYTMLKLVDEKKVKNKEDGVRHDNLVRKLKNEELALKDSK